MNICKKELQSDRLQDDIFEVVFAHYDEAIPSEFELYGKPQHISTENLKPRHIQKWKSRRTAFFLLNLLFEKYDLEKDCLNQMYRTESGRPFIEHPNIDFNISHSGEWVAVIFSYSKTEKVVGIDIEHPLKKRRFAELIQHYGSQQEIAELLAEPENLAENFYLSWCLREAVLKSQGVGIVKLSEVQHFPNLKTIQTAYAPTGTLHFLTQFPFYMSYFFQGNGVPLLSQFKSGNLQKVEPISPLVYRVNYNK